MTILFIGGTIFVGRHLVEAALARGHDVTLFHRGVHGAELFPSVPRIRGDRHGDLRALARGRWDAVVDTCGMLPRAVARSAAALSHLAGFYALISTISVYRDPGGGAIGEDTPLEHHQDESAGSGAVTPENYGAYKAGCEAALRANFPGRKLIIRPGIIAGPHDPTDRFTYWVRRLGEGGQVLSPGSPERGVQIIDVRDLSVWVMGLIEKGSTGVFNATGPRGVLSMRGLLESCRGPAPTELVWVDDDFLEANDDPGSVLPLWLPEAQSSFFRVSSDRARSHGLAHRPLEVTVRDVRAWDRDRGLPEPLAAGPSRSREAELLDLWRRRMGPPGITDGCGG